MMIIHHCKTNERHWTQDGSGGISAEELLEVMRAMGENPTEDEVLIIVNIIPTFLLRYWLFDRDIVGP